MLSEEREAILELIKICRWMAEDDNYQSIWDKIDEIEKRWAEASEMSDVDWKEGPFKFEDFEKCAFDVDNYPKRESIAIVDAVRIANDRLRDILLDAPALYWKIGNIRLPITSQMAAQNLDSYTLFHGPEHTHKARLVQIEEL